MPEMTYQLPAIGTGVHPGRNLGWDLGTRMTVGMQLHDDWYLYGILAPFELRSTDNRRAIARHGLDWAAEGIYLRADHDGPILGASVRLWETDTELRAVFRLSPDPDLRHDIAAAVGSGRCALSAGYLADETRSSSRALRGSIFEASLVDVPAFPEARILGLYTPGYVLADTENRGELTLHHGPETLAFALGAQLLDALAPADRDSAEVLRILDTIPADNPTTDTVHRLRAAAAPEPVLTRGGLEEYTGELQLLEVRNANGRPFLEARCVPYGEITDDVPGRRAELFRRGAFAGTRPDRVKLRTHNHDRSQLPAGVATTLEERDDGLYGTFRLFDTVEGRSAAENVREGVYAGVSVGFHATDDPTVNGIREIRRARLDHVSLVESPAYAGARITGISRARSALPERDYDA